MRIKEEYKVREMAGEHIVVMQGRYGVDMTKVIALNETSLWLWNRLQDVSSVPTMSAICSSASTTWMRKPPSATPRRGSPGSKRVI